MRVIGYEKFMRFVSSNPSYEVHETGDFVEVTFHTPSIEEASSSMSDEEGSRAVIKLLLKKVGDELVLSEAWVEREGVRHPLSLDSFDTWLEFIDMYS
ncbi:hypothetical protein [Vulcanisaeta thermophila]|uniref:hypothetical protein n=1 Tax=Vulcanisaeta thermophila TaxID=867917 RepID=UPI00085357FD|nr:hypothetical protein [Vulcanisaeta thermophila]